MKLSESKLITNQISKQLINFKNSNMFIAYLVISVYFLVLVLINTFSQYGYFRDEFYFIACTKRLALGYVDHPPLSIWVLFIYGYFFGFSKFILHLLPVIISCLTVFFSGKIAEELGGNKRAIFLTTFSVCFIPLLNFVSNFYSMNVFEPLLWTLIAFYAIKIIKRNNSKFWMQIGFFMGLALLNKHTSILFIAALFFGMIFTGFRAELKNKFFWIGMLICFTVFLPNLIWQIQNSFLSIEFYKKATELKNVNKSAMEIILTQILTIGLFSTILWLSGIWFFAFNKSYSKLRAFAFSFVFLFLLLIFSKSSRPDRIFGIYPVMIAGGAVFLTTVAKNMKYYLINILMILIFLTSGFVILVGSTILPPETQEKFSHAIAIDQMEGEKGVKQKFLQILADRIGWEEKAKYVADAYNSLTSEEKKEVVIYASNYGQAGACEFFNKIPRVICGHNSYWHWGTYNANGKIIITIGRSISSMKEGYEDVQVFSEFKNEFVVPHENNVKILICRKPKFKKLSDVWYSTKFYI